MFKELIQAIRMLAHEVREWRLAEQSQQAILERMDKMEENIMVTVNQIKAAVAEAKKLNREAFGELGVKIADLNKQIADLIAAQGDPNVTDEVFEQDLRDLAADARALADIVPGTVIPPTEPTP